MIFLSESGLPDKPTLIKDKPTMTFENYVAARQERREAWDELWTATDEVQSLTQNANAQGRAQQEAFKARNTAILTATGMDPAKQSKAEIRAQLRNAPSDPAAPWSVYDDLEDDGALFGDLYKKRLKDIAAQFPEHAATIKADVPIEEDAYVLAQAANNRLGVAQARADAAGLSGPNKFGATLGGSVRAMLRDPIQVGTLMVGGGPGIAKTVIGKIFSVMLTEAVVNMGVESVVQVASHDWKVKAGLDASTETALEQVGMAGLFGGGFGGLLEGSRQAFKAMKVPIADAVLQRAVLGEPSAMQEVATALGKPLSDTDQNLLKRAAADDELHNAAYGSVLSDQDRVVADRVLNAVENDVRFPDLPEPVRPEFAPNNFQFFDPARLAVDAQRFQFKAGGDADGVTDRLRGVEQWNPERAGVIVVFEDGAGKQFVADGHQRTGLAQRIAKATGEKINVPGYVFRESDGYTPELVRTIAALKNIGEGSGSAIDAAKVLRTGVSAREANLPPSSALVRDAAGLARLSDDAFTMAVNEVVKPSLAAVVGRLSDNRALDAQMLGVLKSQGAKTIADAESMVRDLTSQVTFTERQDSLFGSEEVTRMLLKERAQVRVAAMNALKKDRQVFAMLAQEEQRVSGAGNILNNAANKDRANEDGILIDIIERLVNRTGPIADAFNNAAKDVAGGTGPQGAARGFVEAVRSEIARSGGNFGAIGRDGPSASQAVTVTPDTLRPSVTIEPASKEGVDLANLALIEARGGTLSELEDAGQVSLFRAPAEQTDAGLQVLIPGVGEVTIKQKLDLEASKPMRGGDRPAGGLFDEAKTKQLDIADMIPAGKDAQGNAMHVSHAELIEAADRDDYFGDLIASCRS